MRSWGTTEKEREGRFPIDDLIEPGGQVLFRGITIRQPCDRVWSWLGQLRLAPYSYDWLDNGFRRSPRRLVGLPPMTVGDDFMVWLNIAEVDPGKTLTALCRSYAELKPRRRWFQRMVQKPGFLLFNLEWVGLSYRLVPVAPGETRLLVKLRWKCRDNFLRRLTCLWFEIADFIMMRKQLRTLKKLAESA
jgi:hypothetical protein